MRRGLALAALAVPGLFLAGVGAPAAGAADDCPNAAVRAQQTHASTLPNCFAYERVTPNDKLGAAVLVDTPVSADGSAISLWSTASMLLDDTSGHTQLGTAFRGPDGWKIRMLANSPEWGRNRASITGDNQIWQALSADFLSLLFRTSHPLDPGDSGTMSASDPTTSSADLYLSKPDGTHVWVTAPASGVATGPQTDFPKTWRAAPDLSWVVFDAKRVLDPAVDATANDHVWLFRDGRPTELVDRLPNGAVSTSTSVGPGVGYARVAEGARTVVFSSATLHGRDHVYARLNAGTPNARTVLVTADAAGVPCPGAASLGLLSEDGRYVSFGCDAQLTPDAPIGGGTYIRDLQDGTVRFGLHPDGTPLVVDPAVSPPWTRPEGTYRVEVAKLPPTFDDQIYRTDLASGLRECVSCPTDGSASTAPAYLNTGPIAGAGGTGLRTTNGVSPGGEVAFATTQALLPQDRNGVSDVYLWKDGRHVLLSTGTASADSTLGGMSLDGSTISITTASSLVPEDRDGGARDAYVLRRNGGFLRSGTAEECRSGCQGPASLPAAVTAPLSVSFLGGASVPDDGADPVVVSGSRSVRGTSLKVKVRVPGAGRVSVSGSGLRSTSRSLTKASSASLTVRLSARSQRRLRRKGSVRITASVRFVPRSGATQTKRVSLTFRKKASAKKKPSRKTSSRAVVVASNGKAVR